MSPIRTLPDPQNPGQEAETINVKVTQAVEPFGYITLEDGTEITLRTIVLEVSRFKDRWDQNGNPVYNITSQSSISITAPDNLKKGVTNDAS